MSDMIPLSAEQQSMLYLEKVFGGTVLRNVLTEIPLPSGVDHSTAASALRELGHMHAALRTTLAGDTGQLQVTDTPITLDPPHAGVPPLLDDCRLALRLRNPGRHTGPRAYSEIHTTDNGRRILLSAFDHLICDGTARKILIRHLAELISGLRPEKSRLTLDQHCAEQSRTLADEGEDALESDAWRRMLRTTVPLAGLVARRDDPEAWRAVQIKSVRRTPLAYRSTRSLMKGTRSTAFTVIAGLLAAALWRRTGIPASAIVTPISNRRSARENDLVTTMVNERPIPYSINPEAPLENLISEVRRNSFTAMKYSRSPIPVLAGEVPEFHAMFGSPGTDYLQLQVTLANVDPPHTGGAVTGFHPDLDAGPYRPASDTTCTVMRVSITPSTLTIGIFYAGPANGRHAMREIACDLTRLIPHAGDRLAAPVAAIVS
jgi:hypothetical protein